MKIFAFDFSGPAHLSAGLWRHPKDRGAEYNNVEFWVEYARLLEDACFDGIFFADNIGYHDVYKGSVDEALRDAAQIPANDPAYLIPAMAAATKKLGFGVTTSTAYEQPYTVARKFSTLDHLTKGRVGWNVVTSYSESAAQNHGAGEQRSHDDRYTRAEEFIDVCLKLWEGSWEDDAVVRDAAGGTYADPAKVHAIAHSGPSFTVPGIHLCEPSPQRTPVIFQAGGSSRGIALAANTAEAVFMNSTTKSGLKKWVDTLRAAAVVAGRRPESIAVLQMVTVISAATDEEAQAKYEDYLSYVSYEGAMARYSGWAGLDMSTLDPDVPLADVKTSGTQTMLDVFTKMDPDKVWTPRAIAEYIGIGGTSPVIVGGPETCANELESWVRETGISGFNIAHAVKYQDIKDFTEFVVPELQNRGAMRTDGGASTLREKLFGAGNALLPSDHPGSSHGIAYQLTVS
ncbi:LLM class flavin-dependent oxidoreductase [Cryobacterium melibiosiphilum]|uniref:LLM class flavin-dependent oxidoreductase n=2 Tax=Cryobacterium melibiosiphilum TaxID=995039 RepID=A0A3A5MRG3_9MICO|nr:LLM class flavin-dependent oxidoreductase [Cryobacterium melibiosiphilum]